MVKGRPADMRSNKQQLCDIRQPWNHISNLSGAEWTDLSDLCSIFSWKRNVLDTDRRTDRRVLGAARSQLKQLGPSETNHQTDKNILMGSSVWHRGLICRWANTNIESQICAEILHWCHNGRNDISNQRRLFFMLTRLFRRRWKKTSKLCVTGLWEGNPPVTRGPVTPEIFAFHDVIIE